jgi:hypothetical protein
MSKSTPFNFLTLLLAISSLSLIAQPTLTGSGCNPLVGDELIYNHSDYITPGNAGANQTWNLSAMTTTASSSEFVTPASTPSPGIPNANLSLQVGSSTYYYYKANSVAFQNCSDILGGAVLSYSDPEDILHYPFTFNGTFTDTYQGSGMGISRNGTSTVTADGHGTLITPAGTYTNVLRVHIYRDFIDGPGSPNLNVNRKTHEYRWYTPNSRFHLASVYTQTTSSPGGTTTAQGGMYVSNYVTELNEQNAWATSVGLYPVPTSDLLHIQFSGHVPTTIKVNLHSSVGSLIMESIIRPDGKTNLEFNLADVPNGIYFVSLNGGNGYSVQKRIVIAR